MRMVVHPAAGDSGIFIQGIRASWKSVVDTSLSVTLGQPPRNGMQRVLAAAGVWISRGGAQTLGRLLSGPTVSTVEHLMAALSGCGIDNAKVEVRGGEVPIMDGSAKEFVSLLKDNVVELPEFERRWMLVEKEVIVDDGHGRMAMLSPPSDEERSRGSLTLHVEVNYDEKFEQGAGVESERGGTGGAGGWRGRWGGSRVFEFEREDFEGVASARTFCFHQDVEQMTRMGLARGGSLLNAVVFKGGEVMNDEGLRFPDEMVRHKALDALGDLSLGGRLVGRYRSVKAGHAINVQLLRKLFASGENYRCA